MSPGEKILLSPELIKETDISETTHFLYWNVLRTACLQFDTSLNVEIEEDLLFRLIDTQDILQIRANLNRIKSAIVFGKDKCGLSCLHTSINIGNLNFVKLFLKNGARVNARDSQGLTPLHSACLNAYPEIASYLLDQGADPKVLSEHDCSPLHYLVSNGKLKVEEISDLVKRLLASGVDVNKLNIFRQTPLYLSCKKGSAKVALFLISMGALPSLTSSKSILLSSSLSLSSALRLSFAK